ncbi:hypothetical protein CONPUDRAFT_148013 [Coniophora puteana RWD-64-598 SS2]|uniref:Uncharacterized protein n=1 Tax=Coniophora puteana (strain RWD-64-598) TaxID=741705 RepID=A0A5M3N3E6_CONPW|nr:uncharacterized protein CONPUDRAFT_148013 [Coniophora puteana RWD-64-598 SS2]EIW85878.1 hypothetical protein CONPUDRAFT_148013 [Coniophora puteana RWD-64-598 SS2]
MFGHKKDHEELTTGKHTGSLGHEMLAGAAAYEASKAYENHCKSKGKPANHAKAVEMASAVAGGFIDKIAETKGMDAMDKEKAKHSASQHVSQNLQKDF